MDKIDTYNYNLPDNLIADEPVYPRDHARLLILSKNDGAITHKHFYDLLNYIEPGDCLVLNNSRVFPARLIGQKEITHGRIEILLNKEIDLGVWEAIGRGLEVGKRVVFTNSPLQAIVTDKSENGYQVRFNFSGFRLFEEFEKIGRMPLPPYIVKKRKSTNSSSESMTNYDHLDQIEYQTVYAKETGSVAAPTAGMHFTSELIENIQKKGVEIAEITLHVGLGTFAPIKSTNFLDHKMHSERYYVDRQNIDKIVKVKKNKGRVISVGTTTTRVLEHLWANDVDLSKGDLSGETDIFIYPGYQFKCIDAMITNFHLPKSTLLLLVSAFAGKENIKRSYQVAINQGYRFYSYGDAMLII